MVQITTRAGKGSPLTNAELDGNFTSLRDAVMKPAAVVCSYDATGVLAGLTETLPGGTRTTTCHYDAGVLTRVTESYAGVTQTMTYEYDQNGRLSGWVTEE